MMRRGRVATMVLVLAVGWTAAGAAQQTAEQRFQAGLYQEEVQGNLQQAIAIYESILKEHAANRIVAAKAQLHIGLCYETLGLNEAQRAYQQVIDKYGDQSEVVSQARARLAALGPGPTVGRGPVARKVLSFTDTDINDFIDMAPSPDGRRVAYINYWNGGLYVRDLSSGRVEQVAVGMPAVWYFYPRWSPDGRRLGVAYWRYETSTRAIRVVDIASREVHDVPGTETEVNGWTEVLQWSRDGRQLLCNRPPRIALIAVDDGAMTVLVDSVFRGTSSLSPDEGFLAYETGAAGSEQIFIKPVAGGAARQLTEAPGGNSSPLWAPDGHAIAYNRADGIWLVPVANGSASGAPELVYPTTAGTDLRGWTEAGGLYFTLRNDVTLPYRIPVDPTTGGPGGGVAEVLPSHPEDLTGFAWSPDMQRVAFGNRSSISVHAADRQASTTFDVGGRPWNLRWSPDGREIQFVSAKQQPSGLGWAVEALDPATGQVREMIPWSQSRLVWSLSPVGRQVVIQLEHRRFSGFGIAEPGQPDMRVLAPAVDAEGTHLSQWVRPQLSPRGDQMLFGRQGDAGALWVVGTDGLGARRLASVESIWSAVLDPSGRFIAFTGTVDSATTVLRVVEVATGAVHDVPLPSRAIRPVRDPGATFSAVDWSRDGKFIGIVASEDRWEFWALQGLREGKR